MELQQCLSSVRVPSREHLRTYKNKLACARRHSYHTNQVLSRSKPRWLSYRRDEENCRQTSRQMDGFSALYSRCMYIIHRLVICIKKPFWSIIANQHSPKSGYFSNANFCGKVTNLFPTQWKKQFDHARLASADVCKELLFFWLWNTFYPSFNPYKYPTSWLNTITTHYSTKDHKISMTRYFSTWNYCLYRLLYLCTSCTKNQSLHAKLTMGVVTMYL